MRVWPQKGGRRGRLRSMAGGAGLLVALALGALLFWGGPPPVQASRPASPVAVQPSIAPVPAPAPILGRLPGEVERGPRGHAQVALTFDAGAEADCFSDLLAALETAHIHSTFFITGKWVQQNRDCAAEITKRGHEVGNHTWNHLDLTTQPDDVVREEIARAETLLMELTGQSSRPRWRAPFGARDQRILRIAASLGYKSIYWTIDSLDSVEPPKSPQFLIDRVTSRTDAQLDGAIILIHVGIRSTAEALPALIANLQGRGFHLVTISDLLRPAPRRDTE